MATTNDSILTAFPVGNGDTILVTVGKKFAMLIDMNITSAAVDANDKSAYNVYQHLMDVLPKDANGRPYVSVFVNTHPDQDHIRGIDKYLHLGPLSKYDDKAAEKKIVVNELWFSPRVFTEYHSDLSDDAKALKKEANRRIDAYNAKTADLAAGDRIRVIGWSDSDDVEGLDDVTSGAGTTITRFDGVDRDDLSVFVHAPFKADTDDEDGERNDTSIVLQLRFKIDDDPLACRVLLGGDAGCMIWEKIIERSAEDTLKWDLLVAPHHCSWTFFSEESSEEECASDVVVQLLSDHHLAGARVIVSSKPIKDDDDNPPHYIAAEKYKECVGKTSLLCTGEHPDEKEPKPVVFEMTKTGPLKRSDAAKSSAGSGTVTAETYKPVLTPKTYGRRGKV